MSSPTQQTGSESLTAQQPVAGLTQQAQQGRPQQGAGMQTSLDQTLPPGMQQSLEQFFEAMKVCEWCAERCADEGPGMAECIRLCRDVADIASLNARFVARDSAYGPELARSFVSVASACAQECARHQHGHCQDCARVLGQATQTVQRMLQSFQQGQQGQQGQQMQTQTMGTPGQQSAQTAQLTQF